MNVEEIDEFLDTKTYKDDNEIIREQIIEFLKWRSGKRMVKLKEICDQIGKEYNLHDKVWDD